VLSAITDTAILARVHYWYNAVMKYRLIFKKIDLAQTPPLMPALGQKRTSQGISRMSALPPKADIGTRW